MKHMIEKLFRILLSMALLLSLTACGSTEAVELTSEQVETDVQEYLSSFVDENAKLISISQINVPTSNTEQEVTCPFSYEVNGQNENGSIILKYAFENGEWVMKDYADSAVSKPIDWGKTPAEAVSDYANMADEAAEAFANIQANFDVDTTNIENFGNQTKEYPESVNGVSTIEDIADIYRFTLDGKSYAMPCGFQELLDDGWDPGLADPEVDTLEAQSYSVYTLYKGEKSVSVAVANFRESTILLGQGTVIEVTVFTEDKVEFQTGKGLKIGDNASNITELYGSETYSNSDNIIEYRYLRQLGYQDDLMGIMREYTLEDCFRIQWDSSDKINYIQMKYLNE